MSNFKDCYTIQELGPGKSYNVNMLLKNITANGTYLDYITVSYQQGSSVFSALFPCLESFYTNKQSQIILNDNISQNNGVYYINITAFNAGRNGIYANLSIILPPDFTYISQSYNLSYIKGLNRTVHTFIIKNTQEGSYSGAIDSSYIQNNVTFSTFLSIVLAQNNQSSNTSIFSIGPFYIIVIIIILLFIILMLRIFLKSRKNKNKIQNN